MPRKWNDKGMGRALIKDRERQADLLRANAGFSRLEEWNAMAGRSVLEQSNLDDLIATIELRKEEYDADMGTAELISGATLFEPKSRREGETQAAHRRELLSIPRRPAWHEGMDLLDLAKLEAEAFTEWRKHLALAAQEENLFITPYERNLDFWRQLWRCMERSDLLVQIVDARDPDFYYCRDLVRYQNELGGGKKMMLLVNKADFLTPELRKQWADHFAAIGMDAVFFSALSEVRKQTPHQAKPLRDRIIWEGDEGAEQVDEDEPGRPRPSVFREAARAEDDEAEPASSSTAAFRPPPRAQPAEAEDTPVPGDSSDEDEEEEEAPREAPLGKGLDDDDDGYILDADRLLEELIKRLPNAEEELRPAASNASTCGPRLGTIGFVGYPNVGKSTVINAMVGAKRVGMSSTPGKTKHIQTLELQNLGVTLCDCPGLVFPSVAATRAHLVINNTVHIDDLVEVWDPIALIVEKVGLANILEHYACTQFVKQAGKRSGDHILDASHSFLAAFALSRNHLLRVGVPDENWAARKVLKDYVIGELLHCELPVPPEGSAEAAAALLKAAEAAAAAEASKKADEEAMYTAYQAKEDEFDDVASFVSDRQKERGMTKRRARHMNKQSMRAVPPKDRTGKSGAVGALSAGTMMVPVG
mmetsp:Transcript_109924/g.236583  ORF Transcript_109924/g.236583 Transcript_109924/m.236583 type:complete len:647 (-) Transcript_109924:168-2108(-)